MMAGTALDLGAFTVAEKQALLTAVKAEILKRITGRVQSGTTEGSSHAMTQMTVDELNRLSNALTVELGYQQPEIRVQPNFAGPCAGRFYPGA